MIACYHPQAAFSDPAFGRLEGNRLFAMWRMLCSRATDLQIRASEIHADDLAGSAKWQATYSFGAQKRPVHNVIEAKFVFREGKIVKHDDDFSMWKWSGMALGAPGKALGWLPPFQVYLRKRFRSQLDNFVQSGAGSAST